ncbi:MAG: hypothetical protein QOI20_312 [Acidimicrobiaceae bacterium]|nr:hypothetical protein [Acidimicrobiaceae bacterium]
MVRRYGLPEPVFQYWIGPYRVDFGIGPATWTTTSFATQVIGVEDGQPVNKSGSCSMNGTTSMAVWGGGGIYSGTWVCTGDYARTGTFEWYFTGPGGGPWLFHDFAPSTLVDHCYGVPVYSSPPPIHEITIYCAGVAASP